MADINISVKANWIETIFVKAINWKPKKVKVRVPNQIREQLFYNHTFSGSLLNYRKNGEPYLCQISIFPIYDAKERLDNFIAFEKEIPVDKSRIDSYLS